MEFTSYIFVGIPELSHSSIDIIRTATVTNIQSTCQFISSSATITSQSANITLSIIINQSVNVTANETNKSATAAIIAASVAGGLLTLCIISICIVVIIINCKRDKTQIRHGLFSIVSM